VNLLLDTHILLWWLTDDATLADDIKSTIDTEANIWVSAATLWEIAIKEAIGKISASADLPERIRRSGFRELPIGFDHATAAARLPMIHRDPFDRMLIAQARCEDLAFVTRDPRCQKYEVQILPA
jgi:PIN domain nuclease of toxin-antitoxin system